MRAGRLRYLVAEARCYWCGTVAGTLEGGWPAHARHADVPALFVDDFDIVLVRSEKLEEIENRPPRGRRRRRFVGQRGEERQVVP